MAYSKYMDRSLDEMAADMHHPRGGGRSRESEDIYRSSRQDDSDDRTLFVSNLNYTTHWQELKEHLKKAGGVEKCDIFKDSSGYSKGFGLVVFEDVQSAERALREFNDTILNNRNMKLRKAMPSKEREREREYPDLSSSKRKGRPPVDPAATVFIHNLDYNVTWQKLKDIFKVVGRVVDVEVLEGRKGTAVVQFTNSDDAIKAIALFHGQMLMDRPMKLRMDSKAPYQPDPLRLKLSTLQTSPDRTRHEHSSSRSSYPSSYRDKDSSYHHSTPRYSDGESRYSRDTEPRYSRETSRRDTYDNYYPPHKDMDREEPYYSKPERRYVDRPCPPPERRYPRSRSRSRSRSRERRRSFSPELIREEDITSVFIRNLPYATTWQMLKDEFRKAGLVKRADIKTHKDGRPSGLAVVYYDSHRDASNAVSMFDNSIFDGRRIAVQFNKVPPKPQY